MKCLTYEVGTYKVKDVEEVLSTANLIGDFADEHSDYIDQGESTIDKVHRLQLDKREYTEEQGWLLINGKVACFYPTTGRFGFTVLEDELNDLSEDEIDEYLKNGASGERFDQLKGIGVHLFVIDGYVYLKK